MPELPREYHGHRHHQSGRAEQIQALGAPAAERGVFRASVSLPPEPVLSGGQPRLLASSGRHLERSPASAMLRRLPDQISVFGIAPEPDRRRQGPLALAGAAPPARVAGTAPNMLDRSVDQGVTDRRRRKLE